MLNYLQNFNSDEICGIAPEKVDDKFVENNPDYIFTADPNFNPVQLFDQEGNSIIVNSWVECVHYINGGWNDTINPFNGNIFFLKTILIISLTYLVLKIYINKKNA